MNKHERNYQPTPLGPESNSTDGQNSSCAPFPTTIFTKPLIGENRTFSHFCLLIFLSVKQLHLSLPFLKLDSYILLYLLFCLTIIHEFKKTIQSSFMFCQNNLIFYNKSLFDFPFLNSNKIYIGKKNIKKLLQL